MTKIVDEIATKSASLPVELQSEVLDFVDFVSDKNRGRISAPKPFESVRGILKRDLSNLENDIEEIRAEMWGNFPREEAK
jgi:hypothetical protein